MRQCDASGPMRRRENLKPVAGAVAAARLILSGFPAGQQRIESSKPPKEDHSTSFKGGFRSAGMSTGSCAADRCRLPIQSCEMPCPGRGADRLSTSKTDGGAPRGCLRVPFHTVFIPRRSFSSRGQPARATAEDARLEGAVPSPAAPWSSCPLSVGGTRNASYLGAGSSRDPFRSYRGRVSAKPLRGSANHPRVAAAS